MGYIIVLVALFGLMWFLLIRPQRRRTQAQMVMQDQLRAGDEIITAGGLHATVRSIEDDVLEIELAPGTTVRLDRRAVAAVVSEPETDEVQETETEPEMTHPEQRIPSDDG
jgi:preprotein translocase subunit YajC